MTEVVEGASKNQMNGIVTDMIVPEEWKLVTRTLSWSMWKKLLLPQTGLFVSTK